jgi:predicted NBD/HSP70 family sugar kinase
MNHNLPSTTHNLAHQRIYTALRTGVATQPELAQATGLSLPTVIDAVKRLGKNNLLLEVGTRQTTGKPVQQGIGRPAKHFRLAPEAHPVLAIDLGGSNLRAALCDLHGQTLQTLETRSIYGFSRLSRAERLAYLYEVSQAFPQAKRIGLCAPGIVQQGVLKNSWLFGLETLSQLEFESALQKPVLLENDARSAAWGELRRGHGSGNFAFVIFAFGIGAGLVSQGQLLRGAHGAAGELSYLPPRLEDFAQPRLGALAYGFFEALKTVSADPTKANWELDIFAKAGAGKKREQQAVRLAVEHLAMALAGIITTLDPERIVLREEFPHTEELVLEPLRTMLAGIGLHTQLEVSALGKDAGLVGVGLLTAEALEQELLNALR